MKKKELKKIIRESIEQLINEEINCKQEFTNGVEACLSQHPGPATPAFDACYATVKLKYKKCTGKDWGYYKTGHRDIMKKNEGVDNTCRNKGFCCQERYSRKNTTATFQDGGCVCPQGSIQTNCPRK